MKKFAIVGVILLLFTMSANAVYWELPRVFAGNQDVNGFAIGDNDYLDFGADNNLRITYDETTNDRVELTMTAGGMYFDVTDITFYSNDPAHESLTFTGFVPIFAGGIALADDVSATFGDGSDATIKYDETTDDDLEITCSNGIAIESATVFDSTVQFSGVPTIIDDVALTLGTNSDATIKYDETTDNEMEITCANGIDVESATHFDSTVDVDGDTTVDVFTAAETATFEGAIDVTYVANDVSGNNNAFVISMQLIENAAAVSGNEDYILDDAALTDSPQSYTVWAAELTDDVPRAIVCDPAATYTGTITITGTDIADAEITEELSCNSDAAVTTTKAFKDITSISATARTGGGDTTMDVGLAPLLGLNTLLSDTAQVNSCSMDNVLESTAASVTVSSSVLSLNTINPHTANDGSKDLRVYMFV